MQGKEFLYFLVDSTGKTYSLDENDFVITTPSPVPLRYTPDGWQEKTVKFLRSDTYYEILRDFTIPLRFVKEGSTIIRSLMYNGGIEAVCNLGISKLNHSTYRHEKWYFGEIDLSKADDTSGEYVDVNVAEGGAPKLLKANEDVTQQIPIQNDAETIVMDGIALKQSTTSLVTGWIGSPVYTFGSHLPVTTIINSEGDKVGTSVKDTIYIDLRSNDGSNNTAITNSDNPIFEASTTSSVTIDADFYFKTSFYQTQSGLQPKFPHPDLTVKVDIRVYNSSNTLKSAITIYTSNQIGLYYVPDAAPVSSNLVLHHIIGSHTVSVDEGDAIYLFVYGTPEPSGGSAFAGTSWIMYWYVDPEDLTMQYGEIKFSFDIRYKPSNIKGYTIEYVYGQLVAKTFGADYTAISNLLKPITINGAQRTQMILSGDAIRAIPNAVIKTTMKDFFKAMDVLKGGAAMATTEAKEVILEDRKEFYAGGTLTDLGEVKALHIKPAEKIYFNKINVGYPDQNYDDVNGKNEFNTTLEFTTPITRVVSELDLVSPYRADGYGIEFTRINLDGKDTTDSESDNDIFILDVISDTDQSGNPIWRPYRKTYTAINGVLSGSSLYNIELSPKRILYGHGAFIRSFCYGLESKQLVYKNAEKNGNLQTIGTDGTITEKDNVTISTLSAPYYKPFNFRFDTMVPLNLPQIISLTKSGRFQFTWKGNTFQGTASECSVKPATNEEQTFELLSVVDNDLLKFIN